MRFLFVVSFLFTIAVHHEFFGTCLGADQPNNSSFVSALGDRRMTNPDARFAFEGWNACNEVGEETEGMGSPRMADCADLINCSTPAVSHSTCQVIQKVNETANRLKAGDPFPGSKISLNSSTDVNTYAVEKEKYLGSLCETNDTTVDNGAWYFWMIMLKNGNLDVKNTTVCPRYGRKLVNTPLVKWDKDFPCFGNRCMNQPLVFRNESSLDATTSSPSLTGGFYGTYDLLDSGVTSTNSAPASNKSYFAVTWQKNITTTRTAAKSSWSLLFKLTTSPNYPWLMMYLRADAATGYNAGYHHNGRGIIKMNKLPTSPNFNVTMNLHLIKGGGPSDQFYLTDLGACWKNNGSACDGDVQTDVTRYVQMIINPSTNSTCNKDNLKACPDYHTDTSGVRIYKNQTDKFPYDAYHLYCAPGDAQNMTEIDKCDPFTNPMQQELVQIIPHPEWGPFGFPTTKDEVNWERDLKFWNLNAGKLTGGMYFYKHPNTSSAERIWTSINVGAEIYNLKSDAGQVTAEWTVSDFDVLVPK